MATGEGETTAKRAQVQAAVLKATEELLEESTFADLGIERIATRAGISRTAFYFYFKDKRELLMRLVEEIVEDLYQQAERWYSGEGDATEVMREALQRITQLYEEHGALLRAIVEVSTYDEEVAQGWRALLGRFAEATERRILDEQAAGVVGPMPAKATAFSLVWMTERTLYQQRMQGQPVDPEDLVEGLLGIWVRSIYGELPPGE